MRGFTTASRVLGRLALAALVTGMLSVVGLTTTATPAMAADNCGSGWYKQSDGEMVGRQASSRAGRTVVAKVNGWVRFCSRSRRGPDQKNQKIIIGYPKRMVSVGLVSGPHRRICLTQRITVNMKNLPSGWNVGFSGYTPGANISRGNNSVSHAQTVCAGSGRDRLVLDPGQLRVTLPNGRCWWWTGGAYWAWECYNGPAISSVVVTTSMRTNFYTNGSKVGLGATHREVDYPN